MKRNEMSSRVLPLEPDNVFPGKFFGPNVERVPIRCDPLDESAGFLGIGRSPTFPLPQWRARDPYRTVFFDEGEGQTLVFVHGLGGNATHWEFVVRELVESYRVVGLDLVGCGWSLKPRVSSYGIEFLRDHLLDFLERRNIRRATLVGHSLGGAVSIAAALKRPDIVDSLALICAAGIAPLPAWMRIGSRALLHEKILYSFLMLGANFILGNVFVDNEDENRYVRWFRESSLRDAPGYPNLKDFVRVGMYLCRDAVQKDYSKQLRELDVPVLAVMGDHDKLTSMSSMLQHLDSIRRLRSVIISRCGHMPMIERPEETLFHLQRFLNKPPM